MKAITILKLPLAPTTEQLESLDAVARACRKSRNSAVENWLLRERGLPLSARQATPPQPRHVRNRITGQTEMRARETSSESTKLYHAMTAAVPELDTSLVSSLASEINSHLRAQVDWRKRNGQKRTRADDILDYEQRPPFSQAMRVPVVSRKACFTYGPQTTLSVRFLRSGHGDVETFAIPTERLGTRIKRKLLDIANGDRKLRDSYFHYRPERNRWYWYLPVEEDVAQPLDATIILELRPSVDVADRPFQIGRRYVGDGRYLQSQLSRILTAEKEIGMSYRDRRTGAGHGRKKRDKAIAIKRLQRRHRMDEFRRKLIVDIVRTCERNNAGRILYREPSLPVRKRCWFALVGIDFDWTRFLSDLKNAATRAGIEIDKRQWKWKEAFPSEEEPTEQLLQEPCVANS